MLHTKFYIAFTSACYIAAKPKFYIRMLHTKFYIAFTSACYIVRYMTTTMTMAGDHECRLVTPEWEQSEWEHPPRVDGGLMVGR